MTLHFESIAAAFEQALQDICTTERIQDIEYGKDRNEATKMWKEINALGYTDALVAEEQGGAGLTLVDGGHLIAAAAHAGVPHPFGATMVARALATRAGIDVGEDCIAMAHSRVDTDGTIRCADVSGVQLAKYVLTQVQDTWVMLPLSTARLQEGSYRPHVSASLHWMSEQEADFRWEATTDSIAEYSNTVDATVMASTMERALELSIEYANQRNQFGRAISKFQAIQQELAIMAAQAFSARFAAEMATRSGKLRPDPLLALNAKLRASEAAAIVTTFAHSTLGAMGITEEHILGVFTGRLHEWRSNADTELSCAEQLGATVLKTDSRLSDFVRTSLTPIITTEG